jgi:diguanylate cyclase (GGDEF)-like protein
MNKSIVIKHTDKSIEQRIDMDMLRRSILGVFIYGLIFPLIFFPLGFNKLQPEISWLFAVIMLLISSLRLVHWVYTSVIYAQNPKLWRYIFQFLSLMQAIILGVFFAMTMYDPILEPIKTVSFMTIGGVCAGSLISLSPRISIALYNLFCLVIPSIYAAFFVIDNMPIGFMICTYTGYLVMMGLRSNKEYLRSFSIEAQLEKQRQELEQLNKIDPLTHIYNRGYFNTAYDIQWHNGIRNKQILSLLLIDIDNFKLINDNYGHLFGDKCLVHISATIHGAARRQTDLIARFGGEEFAILLPDTNLESAMEIAEQLRALIASTPFTEQHTKLVLTTSIGVASVVPVLSINSNSLIEKADAALYEAKDQGRNRVCAHAE